MARRDTQQHTGSSLHKPAATELLTNTQLNHSAATPPDWSTLLYSAALAGEKSLVLFGTSFLPSQVTGLSHYSNPIYPAVFALPVSIMCVSSRDV